MTTILVFMALPAVLTALWFFYEIWPKQSIRLLRDRLFCIRDDLFNLVDRSSLGFEDVAYGMLRANLNGYIRFADGFSLLQMANFSKIKPPQGLKPWNERWRTVLQQYPEDLRDELIAIHNQATAEIFRHVLRTSLIACIMIGLDKLSKRFLILVESTGEAYSEERHIQCGHAVA